MKFNNSKYFFEMFSILFLNIVTILYLFMSPHKFHWSVFWVLSLLWIFFIIYTINNINYLITLSIIFIFISFVRSLFQQYTSTLWGSDAYYDYATAYAISHFGWRLSPVENTSTLLTEFTTDFPIIHLSGIIYSELLNVELFNMVKFLPFLISIFSLVFIYLLTFKIFKNKRIGLISVFLFSILYNFLEFHANFNKEMIAFVFFVISIYMVYLVNYESATMQKQIILKFLSIFFAFMTIIAHHLTSLILLIFFVFFVIIQKLNFTSETDKKNNFNLLMIIFTVAIGYWFSLKYSPIEWIVKSFQDIPDSVVIRSYFQDSLRIKLLKYKEFILGPIFALIALGAIYFRRNEKKNDVELALLIFGFFMGVLTLMFTLIPNKGSGTVWGGRFMLFGYFALFILSAYTINLFIESSKIKKTGIVLFLILIAVFQLFNINPSLYIPTDSPQNSDTYRSYILPSEQTSYYWFNSSGTVAVPEWSRRIFLVVQAIKNKSKVNVIGLSNPEYINYHSNYEFIYLPVKSLNSIDINLYSFNKQLNKIYNVGSIELYKKKYIN